MLSRRVWQSLFVAVPVAVIALAGWATVSVAQEKKAEEPKKAAEAPKTIVDVASADPQFKTLVKLLGAADLATTLKGVGPFTVFAPTDEAFNKLPKGTLDDLMKSENKAKLQGILKYHVVSGKVMAADVTKMDGKMAKTMNGDAKVTVKDGKVMIGTANVTKTDIAASNGVIHVIDAVMMPADTKEAPKAGGAH